MSATRHDRPRPRLLGHAPQLGGVDRALRGARASASSRPAYPGFEVEVEALNADPSPIEALTVPAIIEHLEAVIGELDTPPIIMGHSAGGVFTQLLLDHGLGAAGVAINSAPTEGVRVVPLSQLKVDASRCSRTRRTATRRCGFTPEQWHYAFTNTLQRGGVARALRALPRPGLRAASSGTACSPTSSPATRRRGSTTRTTTRAPLLFISGSEDHLMPPTIQQSNAKHYKSDTVTEIKEFDGYAHLLPAAAGLGGDRRLRARLGARARASDAEPARPRADHATSAGRPS